VGKPVSGPLIFNILLCRYNYTPANIKNSGVLFMQIKSGYLQVLLASIIWGTVGVFARWSCLTPLELSFLRLFFALIALFFCLPKRQNFTVFYLKDCLIIGLAGTLFVVDCLFFFHALQLTTLSNAVFPYSLQPAFVGLLTPLFLKERIELKFLLAFTLSLVGLGILLFPSMINLSYADLNGLILALAGTFCLSVITLLTRLVDINTYLFVFYEMLVAFLLLMPFIKVQSSLVLNNWLAVITIGVVHTALAYVYYYEGLKKVKIQYGVTLGYFVPVVASLAGLFLFKEAISIFTIVGGLLIIINGTIVIFMAN
jgi:drug/metabolite transporter (DMT)-like permease